MQIQYHRNNLQSFLNSIDGLHKRTNFCGIFRELLRKTFSSIVETLTKKRTGNCQFSNFLLMNTFWNVEMRSNMGDTMKPWINFYCGKDREWGEAIKPELLKNAQTNDLNMQNPNESALTSRRKNLGEWKFVYPHAEFFESLMKV